MFEKASRLRLRFTSNRGIINTEDLWNLSLTDLDSLAKSLNKQIKESEEESFITTKSEASNIVTLKFELVKHVIAVRLEEQEAKKSLAAKKAQKVKLLELIEKKQNADLENKSADELKKMLEDLDV